MARKTHVSPGRPRILQRDGSRIKVRRIGNRNLSWRDHYLKAMTMPWKNLIAGISLGFIIINSVFAYIYLLVGGVKGARPHSFIDLFFFSVQTFSTIGYGRLEPEGMNANIVVAVEALVSLGSVAMVTGILFNKLARPNARVLFSSIAIIAQHDGLPSFMFRAANERSSRIIEPVMHVVLLRDEVTKEGRKLRRFHDLKLVREYSPLLLLSWTAIHPITEHSPLYGATPESLREMNAEIIVSLTGLDETLSQTVHAQHSYIAEEIIFDRYFRDVIVINESGLVEINYNFFHDLEG